MPPSQMAQCTTRSMGMEQSLRTAGKALGRTTMVPIRHQAPPARGPIKLKLSGDVCFQKSIHLPQGGYRAPRWTLVSDAAHPYPQRCSSPRHPTADRSDISLRVDSVLCTAKCPLSLKSICGHAIAKVSATCQQLSVYIHAPLQRHPLVLREPLAAPASGTRQCLVAQPACLDH